MRLGRGQARSAGWGLCVWACVCVSVWRRPDGKESGGEWRGDLEVGRVQGGGLDEEKRCRWSGPMEREDGGVEEGGGTPNEG